MRLFLSDRTAFYQESGLRANGKGRTSLRTHPTGGFQVGGALTRDVPALKYFRLEHDEFSGYRYLQDAGAAVIVAVSRPEGHDK